MKEICKNVGLTDINVFKKAGLDTDVSFILSRIIINLLLIIYKLINRLLVWGIT